MKLSISNIGWEAKYDEEIYGLLKRYGYTGLEIAPTRIFPEAPYDRLDEAKKWSEALMDQHGLVVSSMQSIWYGRQERIFSSDQERNALISYTKKAIDFAVTIGCKNLVFGCPKNRVLQDGEDEGTAVAFFRELGEYAAEKGTAIAMEANPPIYGTNYINNTKSALELIRKVNSDGFLLNLDTGAMIYNGEDVSVLAGNVCRINHVHISEPRLKPIEKHAIHSELKKVLEKEKYAGYISIEMGNACDISMVRDKIEYVKDVYL